MQPRLERFAPWPLLALPMLVSAAVRGLWAPDEPRYAEVAREAFETGRLVVLHLCGDVYADKPPLVYWLSGLTGWATGWTELGLRLPSIAATLGTAWLVARFAKTAWSEREAWLAPAIFLTCALVYEMGGRLQLDPVLTFFCTASLYVATAGGRFGAGGGARVAAGALLGLGALAKGPVAWSNVGLVLVAWVVAERRFRRPHLADLGFVVAAVAPVAAWAAAAIQREPALRDELLFRQHVGRITRAISHPGPFWEPLVELLLLTMPWTLLVVAGGLRAARRGAASDPGTRRAGLWLASLVVFFSLVAEKRNLYLLPAYPAAALLAARWVATRRPADRRQWRWVTDPPAWLLAAVGVAACFAFVAEDRVEARVPGAAGLGWRGPLLGIPTAALAVHTLIAARRGDPLRYARRLAATTLVVTTGVGLLVLPLVDRRKSPADFARVLAARPERPAEIPCLGVQPDGYRFYSRRPTVDDPGYERTLRALDRDGPDLLLIVEDDALESAPPPVRARVRDATEVLYEERVGSRTVQLLGRAR